MLTEEELEGVLAHELGHVNNRDILISSIAATIAGAITYVAHMGRWAMFFGGMDRDSRDRGGGIGRNPDADPGSDRRHDDSIGRIALARVPGRRVRGAATPATRTHWQAH